MVAEQLIERVGDWFDNLVSKSPYDPNAACYKSGLREIKEFVSCFQKIGEHADLKYHEAPFRDPWFTGFVSREGRVLLFHASETCSNLEDSLLKWGNCPDFDSAVPEKRYAIAFFRERLKDKEVRDIQDKANNAVKPLQVRIPRLEIIHSAKDYNLSICLEEGKDWLYGD